jgi:uncharacterized protein (DUF2235 family)
MREVIRLNSNKKTLESVNKQVFSVQGRKMSRNIVICCDGTGNEIKPESSNVLKLYRLLDKNQQLVYYDPGIGTISTQRPWHRLTQKGRQLFNLASGTGLDRNVLDAYRFLIENHQEDDQLFLIGFSRGAYTVRVLAGLIHLIGLLKPYQLNLAGYAYKAYKLSSQNDDFTIAWNFRDTTKPQSVPIKFLGIWDTVSSVLIPSPDRLLGIKQQTLPYTKNNPSVEIVRHALAIDERRRMFRANHWGDEQTYNPNRFDESEDKPQDTKQVWFAGYHSDIGGGHPEERSGTAKYSLKWMLEEAKPHGLKFNQSVFNNIVLGKERKGSKKKYTAPSSDAPLNDSMNTGWQLLEYLPRQVKYQEWPKRDTFMGFYLPQSEPRTIEEGALIHHSVTERIELGVGYRPINLPETFETIYDADAKETE